MKYLTGIVLLLLMQGVTASECRVNGGPWVSGTWVPVTVPVIANPSTGRIDLDGFRLECRYTPDGGPSSRKDFWHTTAGGVYAPELGRYKMGLRIHNRDYLSPVPGGIHIATMPNNGIGVDLGTYLYILTQGVPGSPINIRAGDEFATMTVLQSSNYGNERNIYIHLTAANSLIIEPSTCTINNNQPIEVNFNNVDRTQIGESVSSTPIRVDKRLDYRCPDAGITLPITITFKGLPASFNTGVLGMSNPNLGAGLLRAGTQVAPGRSFQTNIYNSSGSDTVTFALIRKPGSTPATGAFSGSATLVMGVP